MAIEQPVLKTDRLLLRPFSLNDSPDVQILAGDRAIAATTLSIPHPYEDGMAEEWIGSHQERYEKGEAVTFAITLLDGNSLIGAIGLEINQKHERAEMGYWIGKPYWNNGYCTEAAEAVVRFGFDGLNLHRIHASHFSQNRASGRVMEKIGMKYEGKSRQHIKKWGRYEDLVIFAPLKPNQGGFVLGSILYVLGLVGMVVALLNFKNTPLDRPVTTGLYKISRNPQQVTILILFFGISFAIGSWLATILLAIGAVMAHVRVLAEEKSCLGQYGASYKSYMEQVPRYFVFF